MVSIECSFDHLLQFGGDLFLSPAPTIADEVCNVSLISVLVFCAQSIVPQSVSERVTGFNGFAEFRGGRPVFWNKFVEQCFKCSLMRSSSIVILHDTQTHRVYICILSTKQETKIFTTRMACKSKKDAGARHSS